MNRRFILLAGAASLCLPARLAAAHAHLQTASPAVGSVVDKLPERLICTYSEALEPSLCRLEVRDAAGDRIDQGPVMVTANPRQIAVALRPGGAGAYAVSWVAVSVDTHRTEGRFRFTVRG